MNTYVSVPGLTCLDAGAVVELVAGGTLALELSVGSGGGGRAVGADTGVAVPGLGQTQ